MKKIVWNRIFKRNVTFIHKILAFLELKKDFEALFYKFLFRTEIWLEFLFESAAVGLSLQNVSEYFTRKELKLSSYEE